MTQPAYRRGDHVIVAPHITPQGSPRPDGTWHQHQFAGTVVAVTTYPAHPNLPTHYLVDWPARSGVYEAHELLPATSAMRTSRMPVICPACDQVTTGDLPDDPQARHAAPLIPGAHDCTATPALADFTAAIRRRGITTLGTVRIEANRLYNRRPGDCAISVYDTSHPITTHGPHGQSETNWRPLGRATLQPGDDQAIADLHRTVLATLAAPPCTTCDGLRQTIQYCSCRHGCSYCQGYNPTRCPCPDCA